MQEFNARNSVWQSNGSQDPSRAGNSMQEIRYGSRTGHMTRRGQVNNGLDFYKKKLQQLNLNAFL